MYLHGLPKFVVETDHKLLIPILNTKDIASMSPRIQRLRMRLLKYSLQAKWEKGIKLTDVDAFSRSPTEIPTKEDEIAEKEIECHINTVIKQLPATEKRIEEIRDSSMKDKTLRELIKVIREGWPTNKSECPDILKSFWDARHDLTEVNNLILNGTRLVIPYKMHKDMIKRIHAGHQGIEKCKRRARQSCYWPNINKDIENAVRGCKACRELLPSKSVEELEPHEVPTKGWQKLGTDLFSIGSKNYLIVTDYYSLWPEVYLLKTTQAKDVVEATKEAFARHGYPEEVVSDNGTQYKGKTYKQFARKCQFKHTTSSPRHPRSNGLAESSVKTVKKLIKKCNRSKEDILEGLLIIRNTPLPCGKSPAQLLMGKELRDNLPRIEKTETYVQRDLVNERKTQKQYHDSRIHKRNRQSSLFSAGQKVAVQHHVTKEWSLRGEIIKETSTRSYEIRMQNGRIWCRNRRFIRKIYSITISGNSNRGIPQELNDEGLEDTLPYEMQDETSEVDSESDNDTTVRESNHNAMVDSESDDDTILYGEEVQSRYGRRYKRKSPIDYEEL